MKTKVRFRPWRARWNRLLGRKTVSLDGVILTAEAEIVGKDVQKLLYCGVYEFAEIQLLKHVLQPSDAVLDIGAGSGATGLTAAKIVGPDRVTSYEANPALEPLIRQNYDLNSLHPNLNMKAVTTEGASVTFNVMPSLISSSLIDRGNATPITVESVAINDAIAAAQPSVLVIDAEGAELDILPVADLSHIRAILVETHAKFTGQQGVDRMVDHLLQQGFVITHDRDNNLLLVRD